MAKIEISKEDYEFLKELQHELNTQPNDGSAEPVYWGVMDYDYELTAEGNGEPRIGIDGESYTLEGAIECVNDDISEYDKDIQEAWAKVNKEDADDVAFFMKEELEWNCDVYWVEEKGRITRNTGAFITKRACKEYIERFGYNHNKAHTYAMTAYRNFELERLLKILRTMNLED